MLHHIKKLHAHPEHVREKIAIGGALIVSMAIFAAWMMTLDTRLAISDWGAVEGETASAINAGGLTVVNERTTEPRSPVGILKEKVGETYSDFREAVGY